MPVRTFPAIGLTEHYSGVFPARMDSLSPKFSDMARDLYFNLYPAGNTFLGSTRKTR